MRLLKDSSICLVLIMLATLVGLQSLNDRHRRTLPQPTEYKLEQQTRRLQAQLTLAHVDLAAQQTACKQQTLRLQSLLANRSTPRANCTVRALPPAPTPCPHMTAATPTPSATPTPLARADATCAPDLGRHVKLLTATDMAFEKEHCVPAGLPGRERFTVCVHDNRDDQFVSGSLIRDGVWEPHVLERFVRTLEQFPNAGVLDVGAQLGMYGLQAASLRHPTIMVEAMEHNANHILHSLQHNKLFPALCETVFLVRNAVSSASHLPYAIVHKSDANNGGTAWGRVDPKFAFLMSSKFQRGLGQTTSITLEDLMPLIQPWDQVVVKMDIEGGECEALQGAGALVDSGKVVAIFMEAGQAASTGHQRAPCDMYPQLARLVRAGLKPTEVDGRPLDLEKWTSWPWDMVWERG